VFASDEEMKISEKSLELNVGAELLNLLRGPWGMPKAYLRGLTQREERQQGIDFFVQLNPLTRIFAFQFKAPKGRHDGTPYRYTLVRQQHDMLHTLAQGFPDAVFYVLPFYATHPKLQRDVPNLMRDTWFLPIALMATQSIFGTNKTKTVRCQSGTAVVNPEYRLDHSSDLRISVKGAGVPSPVFAAWYIQLRKREMRTTEQRKRTSPWLIRGLRVAIIEP
jgi:hypothetical protein